MFILHLDNFGPHSSCDPFVNNWSRKIPDLPLNIGGQGGSIAIVKTLFSVKKRDLCETLRDFDLTAHDLNFGRREMVLISLERSKKAEPNIVRSHVKGEKSIFVNHDVSIGRRRMVQVPIERV